LKKKAIGYYRLVCISFCDKTIPIAKSLALIDNLKRSLSFGILRIRAVIKAFFSTSITKGHLLICDWCFDTWEVQKCKV